MLGKLTSSGALGSQWSHLSYEWAGVQYHKTDLSLSQSARTEDVILAQLVLLRLLTKRQEAHFLHSALTEGRTHQID
jgi:hypothetical protein